MNARRPGLLARALANAAGTLLAVMGLAACAADQKPPPPDTKSEGNEESDTADPPQP